jgi:hypothetical protein
MKRTNADRVSPAGQSLATASRTWAAGDEFVRGPASPAPPAALASPDTDSHVSTGHVLWTLTKGNSTAEARRWVTGIGLELELQIWTGPRVQGDEDLSLVQVFTSEAPLAETSLAKKRQLEADGWLEDIEASAL